MRSVLFFFSVGYKRNSFKSLQMKKIAVIISIGLISDTLKIQNKIIIIFVCLLFKFEVFPLTLFLISHFEFHIWCVPCSSTSSLRPSLHFKLLHLKNVTIIQSLTSQYHMYYFTCKLHFQFPFISLIMTWLFIVPYNNLFLILSSIQRWCERSGTGTLSKPT